jgi:hypothetical protein
MGELERVEPKSFYFEILMTGLKQAEEALAALVSPDGQIPDPRILSKSYYQVLEIREMLEDREIFAAVGEIFDRRW